MNYFQEALLTVAENNLQRTALQDNHITLSYGRLISAIADTIERMQMLGLRTIGLLADNSVAWPVADLSALFADIALVPLPIFFSPQQILHVITNAGLDGLLTDRPQQMMELLSGAGIRCRLATELAGLQLIQLPDHEKKELPCGTAKITYTSGTTGEPKGVCLGRAQIEAVALSLKEASAADAEDCHLCLTPLATLLENIGGIYVPLLSGACVSLPPLRHVGLRGASGLDVVQMAKAINEFDATSAILAPQMLHAMVTIIKQGGRLPSRLRFIAVGGAPVSPKLLREARSLGIPVYEGYGMSECASVVALNTPTANQPGSVGRPLPHVELSFAKDGEILVNKSGFLGYLGQEAWHRPFPTGDLGYLDEHGFLHITGRKKSMFITSFGRNVAPEWVERELSLIPSISQVAVFGEARPFNVAVVVPRQGFSPEEIEAGIRQANHSLPDYARITPWFAASEPFVPENGQLTFNGRPKRKAIEAAYSNKIENLYKEEMHAVF